MRIGWKHIDGSVVAMAAAGILITWLGLIDVRASSGHWRITDWFLHFVMRSSIRTAAIATEVPNLDNPAYLPLGAGHYETACADCHGSPERPRSAATLGMLPPPPKLETVIGSWSDAQLFEIVKHGVRYTGMPAWPAANRDDEVWAMVAFLRRYPTLDAPAYRQLRSSPPEQAHTSLESLVASCDACHAPARLVDSSLVPLLDGQSETYLLESLHAFRGGTRPSGVMQAAVVDLDDRTIADLARTYSRRSAPRSPDRAPLHLFTLGDAARGIPACSSCHDKPGLNPAYPSLQGLSGGYIRNQLRLFREGVRGGGTYRQLMARAARNLADTDIEALARYFDDKGEADNLR
jgi:cytochrome c553